MLSSVACSWARTGGKLRVSVAKLSLLSSVAKKSPPGGLDQTAGLNLSQLRSRSSRLLTPAPGQLQTGLLARTVSQRDAPAPEEDEGRLGSLSADLSSRRSFRKTSPELQDLRLRGADDDDDAFAGEEEEEEEELVQAEGRRPGRRNTPYWYFLQCKKLIKDNKLQEALDLFSRDMLQVEKLQPQEYNYTILIGGCGRAGQLKKAFRLYNDMKKRGLNAVDATYTALFNACAESPSRQAGLQQALKLEQELRRKNYTLSTITYHALLKTHAVTNHLQACIHTLREMLQNGHVVTQETLHYLLMGCLKDKETGFRMALQVWRQMLMAGIRPDSKNYNLLLRTARDCGIGSPALATDVLLGPDWEGQRETREHVSKVKSKPGHKDAIDVDLLERQLFIQPGSGSHGDGGPESKHLVPVRQTGNASLPVPQQQVSSKAPSLLDLFEGRRGAVVSLGAVDGPSDRLALIGGGKGFLEKMAANRQSPDLRTLTLLADTMEPGHRSLQVLLRVAKQHHIRLDVAFFNSVIRRAARAGDLEVAKSMLILISRRKLSVDVQTYGSLALGCERQTDGLQLLQDMQAAGLRPNVHVFSALIGRAARRLDYVYLKTLLKSMRDLGVGPNEVIIRQLEFAAQYPPNYDQYKTRNNYLIQIDGFRGYYQSWLRAMPAQDAEEGEPQTEPQTETDPAESKTEAADGLTPARGNQRAAERRHYPHNRDKTSSAAL